MEMNPQATKLQAVENDLKQLMASSGGRGEDSLQGRDRHNGDRIHAFVVFERVIMPGSGHAA